MRTNFNKTTTSGFKVKRGANYKARALRPGGYADGGSIAKTANSQAPRQALRPGLAAALRPVPLSEKRKKVQMGGGASGLASGRNRVRFS